jgi:predicted ATPase
MLLKQISISNLLSFKDATIDLRPLNILIGENGAGKSNLIEIVSLLQGALTDLRAAVLRGGGIHFWLSLSSNVPTGSIVCDVQTGPGGQNVTYRLDLEEDGYGMAIPLEALVGTGGDETYVERKGQTADFENTKGYPVDKMASVLALWKNPNDPTPITSVGRLFERTRIYREFRSGPRSGSRQGVAVAGSNDFLEEGADNLALVLQELKVDSVEEEIRKNLRDFCDRFDDVRVKLDGGMARTLLKERGLRELLPSIRMSDGTLKFLSLMTVLLHPDPPPLVCIEEPEQGLHPDAIQIVARALRDASERMQLIVTTHSQALVDAFTSDPECILVCERDFDGGTQCQRLSATQLEIWLDQYSLGQLWSKGEIGGNRW